MTSGVTILVTIPVLMTNTSEMKPMSLTDEVSTANSQHTVCTATTADEAASAHVRSR